VFVAVQVFHVAVMMFVLVMSVLVFPIFGDHAMLQHVHLRRLNLAAIRRANPQLGSDPQRRGGILQKLGRNARIDQRA
jgi:hypothetical protein